MAEPQIENGYTRIANELLDALIFHRLSGQEYQFVFFVIRKTYGFSKKSDMVSMGQISKATGMNRPRVAMILNSLKAKGIISVTKKDNSNLNILELIKDYETWKVLPKKITVTKNDNTLLPKMITKVLPKMIHTKERKKIIKEISGEKKINHFGIWIDVNREFGRADPLPVQKDTAASKIISKLLNGNSEKIAEVFRRYLEDNDKFLLSNGHGLSFLQSRINKYLNDEPEEDDGYELSPARSAEIEKECLVWEKAHPERHAECERKLADFLKKKAAWEAVHGKGEPVKKTD